MRERSWHAAMADDLQQFEYARVLESYQLLAEIRFKLLAFVSPLAGAAIALLSTDRFDRWQHVALSAVGFAATLGLVMYEQRNTSFYNQLIGRAEFLEQKLELPVAPGDVAGGQFSARGGVRRHLFGFLPVKHDRALALVYSPLLAGWLFPALRFGWPTRPAVALVASAVLAGAFYLDFERLDGTFGKRAQYFPGLPPGPSSAPRTRRALRR